MSHNLKVVSYNIHMGQEPQAVVKNIQKFASEGVKLFCLQEVRQEWKKVSIVELLLKTLGEDWQAEYFLSNKPNSFDYGLCMIWHSSELEPVSFQPIALPALEELKTWEKVFELYKRKDSGPIQRGALIGTFKMGGKVIRVSTAHLDWQGGFGQRASQIKFIKDNFLSHSKVDYEIVCGDFNTLGYFSRKRQAQQIELLLGEGFKSSFTKTYSTFTPKQQLDYIYVKGFSIQGAEVCKVRGSDHFPVMATLKLL
jgi:endonuclease/exonuclease/phosphatase family metal-dependent hydrolase